MKTRSAPVERDAPARPVRIIVNADDLGYDAAVTAATFDLMAQGRVTSATVMATGAAVDEAARGLRELPACSFGAHLALTEFAPLTTNRRLAFLCGPDGAFVDRRDLLCSWKHVWRPGVPDAIFDELCAQVRRLQQLGVPLSHLDSHHHVHAIPALFPIVKRVQATFGIRRIRLRVNRFDGLYYRAEGLTRPKHAVHNLALRRVYASATTDAFTALRAFLRAPGLTRPGEVVELMVHPGHPACVAENQQLAADWLTPLPFPVELISYNQLAVPGRAG